jgi:hypothetical protein
MKFYLFSVFPDICRFTQGLPANRNSLFGHQAEPGGTTGPPTRHMTGGAKLRVDPPFFWWPQTISNHMKQSKPPLYCKR